MWLTAKFPSKRLSDTYLFLHLWSCEFQYRMSGLGCDQSIMQAAENGNTEPIVLNAAALSNTP
ncbi:hypothetical protein NBRC116589_40400 [Ruegeria sp. HU-ET01832]